MYSFDCFVCVCACACVCVRARAACLCIGTSGILLLCMIDVLTCVDFAVACPVAQVSTACQNG
jgi:hypothetical protein